MISLRIRPLTSLPFSLCGAACQWTALTEMVMACQRMRRMRRRRSRAHRRSGYGMSTPTMSKSPPSLIILAPTSLAVAHTQRRATSSASSLPLHSSLSSQPTPTCTPRSSRHLLGGLRHRRRYGASSQCTSTWASLTFLTCACTGRESGGRSTSSTPSSASVSRSSSRYFHIAESTPVGVKRNVVEKIAPLYDHCLAVFPKYCTPMPM